MPASRVRSALRAVDPYLLNPVQVGRALVTGRLTRSVDGVSLPFVVEGVWDTVSLMHTFRKERALLGDVRRTLRPDDVFFDVGANLGAFACLAGAVADVGTVVAFEPHPRNVERLRRNCDRFGDRVWVHECALSDETGSVALSESSGGAGNQRHALAPEGSRGRLDVQAFRGDDLVDRAEVPQPTVVKIDVEGAERQVLEGLASTLSDDRCRVVYCEVHPDLMEDFGSTQEEIRDALTEFGFTLKTLDERGGQVYLRGERLPAR